MAIMEDIKPIFQELSNPEMLRKCLHGMTQNCNESFNGFIWQQCPKTTFTARKILEISAYSSILNHNDGFSSLSCIF